MTRSIAWEHVTDADVVRAIEEYDRLGPEQFSRGRRSSLRLLAIRAIGARS